jgi:hypothetical protein
MFQNVHPEGGNSRSIQSKSVNFGRNAENVALRDDRYVRCKKCNFINHLDRSLTAPTYSAAGTGVSFQGGWGSTPWGSGSWSSRDPIVTSGNGCSFCGSYLYA